SLDRLSGAPSLEHAQKFNAAEAQPEDEIEAPARLGQRKAGAGEQALRRRRLENPADSLLGLDNRDRPIAIEPQQRGQGVALREDVGRALGLGARIEVAGEIAKAPEP